jgi:hypothetical protein
MTQVDMPPGQALQMYTYLDVFPLQQGVLLKEISLQLCALLLAGLEILRHMQALSHISSLLQTRRRYT